MDERALSRARSRHLGWLAKAWVPLDALEYPLALSFVRVCTPEPWSDLMIEPRGVAPFPHRNKDGPELVYDSRYLDKIRSDTTMGDGVADERFVHYHLHQLKSVYALEFYARGREVKFGFIVCGSEECLAPQVVQRGFAVRGWIFESPVIQNVV
jgi:hypothetical protein